MDTPGPQRPKGLYHNGSSRIRCVSETYLTSPTYSVAFVPQDGLTPLHCGARSGHEQVVEMLLDRAAPILSKTKVRSSVSEHGAGLGSASLRCFYLSLWNERKHRHP